MAKVLISDAARGSHFKLRPDQCTIVGLDTEDGPEHPLWDKRVRLPIDPGMVASIKARGVIQPIRVAVEDGVYYVVAGRQRVRSARVACEQGAEVLIPAIADKMGDVERHAEIATIENAIRRDDSALDKAAEAQRALDREVPIAHVAMRFGVTVATIQNWIALLGLAAPVKKAIEAGTIAPTAAAKLADLPKADQVAALELAVQASPGKRVSVKSAQRVANPDAVMRPSKKAALAAMEAMRGTPWADGVAWALGITSEAPDAVTALQDAAQ
jgi:ParB/RepB/Spo0J family partition protein